MKVKIKKLHTDAVIPTYATDGSACFDLYTIESGKIYPGRAVNFHTGISFEIPKGHVMLIYSRSGHGFNHGIRLVNATGIIDSDYRGEVLIKLHNDHPVLTFNVNKLDRIAQAMIIPVDQVLQFEVVEELSVTERGEGGFGSTGK